jgi:MFS transporter, BCD family, chlorophyll transporter
MTVAETTSITSIWGTFVLIAIHHRGISRRTGIQTTRCTIRQYRRAAGFIVIVISGFLLNQNGLLCRCDLLGIGTGLSTVANLSLMFDLTVPGMVGLYIGAWGFLECTFASNGIDSRRCGA